MSIEIAKIAQLVSTRKKFLVSSSTLCLGIIVQVVRFGLAVFFIVKCSGSSGEWASLIVSASWQSALGAAITLCFSVCSNTESEVVMSISELCEKPQYGYTASATTEQIGHHLLRIIRQVFEVPPLDCHYITILV